jgi:hypothetical protein
MAIFIDPLEKNGMPDPHLKVNPLFRYWGQLIEML